VLLFLLAAMASQPLQLHIEHAGLHDRPVPKLVLYASGSPREFPLPGDCPKAALCIPVEPASWNVMVADAESGLRQAAAPRDPGALGTFRFRLLGGTQPLEQVISPRQSSELLLKLAKPAPTALRAELERRAALSEPRQ